MTPENVIGVVHLSAAGRQIPVLLFRNSGRSVGAQCLIKEGDTPILDGPTPDAVLELLQETLEGLLFARERLLT